RDRSAVFGAACFFPHDPSPVEQLPPVRRGARASYWPLASVWRAGHQWPRWSGYRGGPDPLYATIRFLFFFFFSLTTREGPLRSSLTYRPLLCSGPAVRPACRQFSGVFYAPRRRCQPLRAVLATMITPIRMCF